MVIRYVDYFFGCRSRAGTIAKLIRISDYCFSPWAWHSGCWHWQVSSNMPFASAQCVLQCFFPSGATQLQAGCAHLCVVVIKAPRVEQSSYSRRFGAAMTCPVVKRLLERTCLCKLPHSVTPAEATICRFCSFVDRGWGRSDTVKIQVEFKDIDTRFAEKS